MTTPTIHDARLAIIRMYQQAGHTNQCHTPGCELPAKHQHCLWHLTHLTQCEFEGCGMPKPKNAWGLCALHDQQRRDLMHGKYRDITITDSRGEPLTIITQEQHDDARAVLRKLCGKQRRAFADPDFITIPNRPEFWGEDGVPTVLASVARALLTRKYRLLTHGEVRNLQARTLIAA